MAREFLKFKTEKEFSTFARKNARYHAKVYGQDVITDALQKIEELILHEKAHYETAKDLGYDPVYVAFAVFLPGNKINRLVLMYITLA